MWPHSSRDGASLGSSLGRKKKNHPQTPHPQRPFFRFCFQRSPPASGHRAQRSGVAVSKYVSLDPEAALNGKALGKECSPRRRGAGAPVRPGGPPGDTGNCTQHQPRTRPLWDLPGLRQKHRCEHGMSKHRPGHKNIQTAPNPAAGVTAPSHHSCSLAPGPLPLDEVC